MASTCRAQRVFIIGHPPDFDDAIILRSGVSVKYVCHSIHRSLEQVFKYALVWVSHRLGMEGCHHSSVNTTATVDLNPSVKLGQVSRCSYELFR